MGFDLTDVRTLSTDLGKIADSVVPEARKVIQRGALNIKKDMQREAQGVEHAPALPGDISYETHEQRGGIVAEIGPTRGDVGSLALLYFGNSKAAPRLPDPVHALEREAPKTADWLAKVMDLPS